MPGVTEAELEPNTTTLLETPASAARARAARQATSSSTGAR
jgi:hypothetical protein